MNITLKYDGFTLEGEAQDMKALFQQSPLVEEKGEVVKYMIDNNIDPWFEANWISKTQVKAGEHLVKYAIAVGADVKLCNYASKGEIDTSVEAFIPFDEIEIDRLAAEKNRLDNAAQRAKALAKFMSEQAKEHQDAAKEIATLLKARGRSQEVHGKMEMVYVGNLVAFINPKNDEIYRIELPDLKMLNAHYPCRIIEKNKVWFSPATGDVVRMQTADQQTDMFSPQYQGEIVLEDGVVITEQQQRKAYNAFMQGKGFAMSDTDIQPDAKGLAQAIGA